MGLYDRYILPHLIDMGCGTKPIGKQRQKVVPRAQGRVLEIGMGSGLNLPFYEPERVEMVFGLEPSEGMRRRAQPRVEQAPFPVEWLELPGEQIPLEDASVDTVVLTYTLCTIADAPAALAQMRRVLKPSGRLLFTEHGLAPDPEVSKWQRRINPAWRLMAGGCNLDRDIPAALREAGFVIEELETMYLPSTPRFAGFQYWGLAVPKRPSRNKPIGSASRRPASKARIRWHTPCISRIRNAAGGDGSAPRRSVYFGTDA
ncbi:MAG: class I SAM-dependent methyltransferase [Myxococcales bacterium]|nr:class I SAM-dependent methyltransferase [Myxococcales bacterium]